MSVLALPVLGSGDNGVTFGLGFSIFILKLLLPALKLPELIFSPVLKTGEVYVILSRCDCVLQLTSIASLL
jgi:hypothetical protein